jgi:hypothetical protein
MNGSLLRAFYVKQTKQSKTKRNAEQALKGLFSGFTENSAQRPLLAKLDGKLTLNGKIIPAYIIIFQ